MFLPLLLFSAAFGQSPALNTGTPVTVAKPLSPEEALAKFQLAEADLTIELAAAEPDVIDPVAIRFDERGRMWVAEMRDYPLGPPDGGKPLSRIRVLEDRDHDGRFETATTFAEGLSFVTGLQPWRGGVFVTLAGRIAWMKDSDGDGMVDVDETWFTGFAEQNSQLRANHPRLALDNHVYVANGLRGGVVVNKRLPDEKPIDLRGRDFRFDPLTGKAEAISGNGQFGMCFDDWGNRFTCTNRNPVIHVVLEDRYLKLAPKIPIAAVVQDVAAAAEKSKVYPISRAWTTSNLHAGTFTAACGVHVYRGDSLRGILGSNSVFTCDPTGNFIHREIMQPDGPSFTSKPVYEGKEFLASTDEWFRPVSMELGPDGCLYIVDMYRCVIEHPDFVPDELKKRPDQRLGDDKGRIWRIVPKGETARKQFASLPLELNTSEQLFDGLSNASNAWTRETLQRLHLENVASGAASDSFSSTKNDDIVLPKADLPEARVHYLRSLQASKRVDSDVLTTLLRDPNPGVRRQALMVAEELLAINKVKPKVLSQLAVKQPPEVQFQTLLLELTRIDNLLDDRVDPATIPAAEPGSDNRWVNAALLLRHHRNLLQLFETVSANRMQSTVLLIDIARLIGSQGSDLDAVKLLKLLIASPGGRVELPKRVVLLDALASGLMSRGKRFDTVLEALKSHVDEVPKLDDQLLTFAQSGLQPLDVRLAAVRLLGYVPSSWQNLKTFLSVEQSAEVQSAIVAAIAQQGNETAPLWKQYLEQYDSATLPIKRALIENSFRRADGPKLLLEQVAAGVIQPAEIDPLRRKQLLESKDAAIKKQAAELFAALNPANRQQALEEYQPVLAMAADGNRGKVVFEKNCSNCHRVGDVGVNVAPDISDSRTKTAAQILADIIQPNRAIDSNFMGYQVLLADGTIASGLLSAETSTSITLKQPGGKTLTLARTEIEQLKATGVSLMPDGLEKNIPPADMADLLAYIKGWRYLDGKTPLSPK